MPPCILLFPMISRRSHHNADMPNHSLPHKIAGIFVSRPREVGDLQAMVIERESWKASHGTSGAAVRLDTPLRSAKLKTVRLPP